MTETGFGGFRFPRFHLDAGAEVGVWTKPGRNGVPVITRVDANDEIFKKILDDEDFRAALGEFYLRKVYERLRKDASPPGSAPTSTSAS